MKPIFENAPETVLPKCPFCKSALDKFWVMKKGLGIFQQRQIIICPKCESFLAYGVIAR